MAKSPKKKQATEPISVSEIYERIQAKDFLRELWWDLISDIQEKRTYQRIKDMVNAVINNSMDTLSSKTGNEDEEIRRRDTLTEISIMTFTLDTVISEVLYRRYQSEFEGIVKNLIKDLLKKKEKEISASVRNDSVFQDIENSFDEENPTLKDKKENDHKLSLAKKSKISNSPKDKKDSNVAPARKRGRPKKMDINAVKAENVNVTKRESNKLCITPGKSMDESFVDKTMHGEHGQESDAESEISVGNISLDSVSSVHTSELSSFEDTISICSDDEGKKKHIPLKVANEMYLRGKLSQIYILEKRSERLKLKKEASKSTRTKTYNPGKLSVVNSPSRKLVNSPSRKVLPQRIRKPNSKYSSEFMYCDVKDYSSPPTQDGSSSSDDGYNNPSFRTSKRRIKRKRLSWDE